MRVGFFIFFDIFFGGEGREMNEEELEREGNGTGGDRQVNNGSVGRRT